MWTVLTCPNCREKVEVDTAQDAFVVTCPGCQECFRPDRQFHHEIHEDEYGFVVAAYSETEAVDSSIWLG